MRVLYKNTFPICFLSDLSLLISSRGILKILDLSTGEVSNLIKIPRSFVEEVINCNPLLSRILRKEVRCGIKVSDNLVLFVVGRTVHEFNLDSNSVSSGFLTADKSRPLVFSEIEGVKNFKNGIYFGGYKTNPQRKPVSIYRRSSLDLWEVVYEFPSETIEHIHNLIPDPYNNVIYIFTGDFDNSAGIWIAEDNFRSVTPILIGDQKYRSCVGFPTSEGLIYATDSPFTQNTINILKRRIIKWELVEIMDINGPAIYGCRWQNDYVFSTSVEGDGRNQTFLNKVFDTKRGLGIKDNNSIIYKGNLKDGFSAIYKMAKDRLPFYLFQFGALVFASGLNESQFLPVYHIATRRNGMSTVLLKS